MQLHTTNHGGTRTISASGNIDKQAFAKALTNAASDGCVKSVSLQIPMLKVTDANQVPVLELASLMASKNVSIKKVAGQEMGPDAILNIVNKKSAVKTPVSTSSPSDGGGGIKNTIAASRHVPFHKVTMPKQKTVAPMKTEAELNRERALASAKMWASNKRGDVNKAERPIHPDADRTKVLAARAYAKARDEGTMITVHDQPHATGADMIDRLAIAPQDAGHRDHMSAVASAKKFAEARRQGQSAAL